MLNRIAKYFPTVYFKRFRLDMAIDLGTANTLVSVLGKGLIVNEPSIVAIDTASGKILSGGSAVGSLAKQMQGRTPDGIDVVRPLSEGVITDFQLCEAMLRFFLLKAQAGKFSLKPRVIIAAPGCITPVEQRALYNSAHRAGASQVFVLPEAKAAAIGVGLPIVEPVASMICDIGGGTTEVAVMSLGDTVSSRSIRTGGDTMDRAIVDYLRRNYSLKIGIATAEQIRIEYGSAYLLDNERSGEVAGVDTISSLPRKATITSEEIRHALSEPLAEIIDAIKQTIDHCDAQLAADLVENGMVLTGGGSLLRNIHYFVQEQTGIPTRVAEEPLLSVAKGTQICLEHFTQWRSALQSSEDDL